MTTRQYGSEQNEGMKKNNSLPSQRPANGTRYESGYTNDLLDVAGGLCSSPGAMSDPFSDTKNAGEELVEMENLSPSWEASRGYTL